MPGKTLTAAAGAACAVLQALTLHAAPGAAATWAVLSFEAGSGVEAGRMGSLRHAFSAGIRAAGRAHVLSGLAMHRELTEHGLHRPFGRAHARAALRAGRLLGVDTVVFGSLSRDGSGLRLTTALADVATGTLRGRAVTRHATWEQLLDKGVGDNLHKLLGWHRQPGDHEPVPPRTAPTAGASEAVRVWKAWRASCRPRVTLHWFKSRKRDMTESGGPIENRSFKHYRVASSRWFLTAEGRVVDAVRVSAMLGMADLRLHASEGETREFDFSPLIGLSAEAQLMELERPDARFFAALGVLRFEADDDSITHVRKAGQDDGYLGWDRLSVEWTEWQLAAYAEWRMDPGRRLLGGLRVVDISADETGRAGGEPFSGSLKADRNVGLFAAMAFDLPHNVTTRLQLNVFDETAMQIGLGLQF